MVTITLLLAESAFADKVKTGLDAESLPPKASSKFWLKANAKLPLCQELKKIFNEPENEKFIKVREKIKGGIPGEYRFSDSQFVIPKKYKNFRLPAWEDVPLEDVSKYLSPGTGMKGKITAQNNPQKTKIDLDHDGKGEVIIRFQESANLWRCYVSDIEPTIISTNYNKNATGNDCKFFYYKGRPYKASNFVYDIFIEEPIAPIERSDFGMKLDCLFKPN